MVHNETALKGLNMVKICGEWGVRLNFGVSRKSGD